MLNTVDKVLPPMMRPAVRLEASKFCPFRVYGSIDYTHKIYFCKINSKDGYLRICDSTGNEYERTIPDTCPLEDWDKYQKRMQKQKKEESK